MNKQQLFGADGMLEKPDLLPTPTEADNSQTLLGVWQNVGSGALRLSGLTSGSSGGSGNSSGSTALPSSGTLLEAHRGSTVGMEQHSPREAAETPELQPPILPPDTGDTPPAPGGGSLNGRSGGGSLNGRSGAEPAGTDPAGTEPGAADGGHEGGITILGVTLPLAGWILAAVAVLALLLAVALPGKGEKMKKTKKR